MRSFSLLSLTALSVTSSASAFVSQTLPTSTRARATTFLKESAADVAADASAAAATNGLLGGAHISALTKQVPKVVFTSEQIDEILPHRYPFALVDKVIEYEAGKRAVGVKSVTKN